MAAQLLLLLAALAGAQGEVRARDPEVERGAGASPLADTGSYGARTGYKLSTNSILIGRSEPVRAAALQHGDPDREQNDHARTSGPQPGLPGDLDPDQDQDPDQDPYVDLDLDQNQEKKKRIYAVDSAAARPEAHAPLPVPHMMALVMSQLQPLLEGFNRSLEHLSRQVGAVARDVAQLKSGRLEAELQAERLELDAAAEERLDARLDEVSQHIRDVRRQLDSRRTDVDARLHSQHAMLHYNMTSFKMDVDGKLKRQQKMLQLSLQAMNATLTELKQDQDQDRDQDRDQDQDQDRDWGRLPPFLTPPLAPQPADTSALWSAVERLDNMVVNNTVKVDGLMEDVDVTSGAVQQLRRHVKELEKHLNLTARTGQVQFMETVLEVEAAREAVLQRVGELAGNLSQQGVQLQEMDVDVDYLFKGFYKHNSSGDCDCGGLRAALARLERGVANVTELANENRLALDEDGEGAARQWGGAGDWEPAVEALQHGLQQVKEVQVSERGRAAAVEQRLSRLGGSLAALQAELAALREVDGTLREDVRLLSASFRSLLEDAVRHSDVLEVLLGQEVLEFLEGPDQDQEALSIPALKEQLAALLGSAGPEEEPPADQPSSHLLSDAPARERQLLLPPEGRRRPHGGAGGDLWSLERAVEQLEQKVLRLEEKHRNLSAQREAQGGAEAKLQAEVTWLKRGLEEHLRLFKNLFRNADVLARADGVLELDKLWLLVRSKEEKKERRRGSQRSRREAPGEPPGEPAGGALSPSGQSGASVLLLAASPFRASDGAVAFRASLNRGPFYSDSGTFTAPLNGVYLFALTMHLRPGPAHLVLRRGEGGAAVTLQRQAGAEPEAKAMTGVGLLPLRAGEEVRLLLEGGVWAESEDNVFTVLLLQSTT